LYRKPGRPLRFVLSEPCLAKNQQTGVFRETAHNAISAADPGYGRVIHRAVFLGPKEARYFAGFLGSKIGYFLKIRDYLRFFYGRGHGFLWRLDPGSGSGEIGAESGPDWERKE